MKNTENHEKIQLSVLADSKGFLQTAEKTAEHLGVKAGLYSGVTDGLALRLNDSGLALTDGKIEIKGDFSRMIPRAKQSNLNRELIVKAAKIKKQSDNLSVIDATAGLGEDSFLLAAAGFDVTMYEYNPVIAALLRDAMQRAEKIPELNTIVSKMTLIEQDSISAFEDLSYRPNVILLDPMFPERQKSSLVKKKFQLFQQLECPCSDEKELLQAALAVKPDKIIIKRPSKGASLAGKKPSYSVCGKTIRYDCIVL